MAIRGGYRAVIGIGTVDRMLRSVGRRKLGMLGRLKRLEIRLIVGEIGIMLAKVK